MAVSGRRRPPQPPLPRSTSAAAAPAQRVGGRGEGFGIELHRDFAPRLSVQRWEWEGRIRRKVGFGRFKS